MGLSLLVGLTLSLSLGGGACFPFFCSPDVLSEGILCLSWVLLLGGCFSPSERTSLSGVSLGWVGVLGVSLSLSLSLFWCSLSSFSRFLSLRFLCNITTTTTECGEGDSTSV